MKSDAVIIAFPALAVATQAPAPAAAVMANLAARQLATTTTTTTSAAGASVTQDSPSACASSWASITNGIFTASGVPPYPSALDDYYDELRRTATTDVFCVLATTTLPPAISSMEDEYQSSLVSFAINNNWNTEAPPQCTEAWSSILQQPAETAVSKIRSCRSAASTAATRPTNVTSSGTGTISSSAVAPVNTGATGRNAVSAGLVVGAAVIVGYLGMA
ncbi:hypothetical protein MCOR25_007461 [Pyricularia grisea]|uniref:Infection structure specific protein n=1 Tax=Pyricularia grisea TaxID=148305 RepID=A0A6P8AQQ6_PYRGI|nr:uncharacterized protein PgNI_12105 [Pyricularia grisea]KAI6357996.1 hypothetical protein MCOR25_007461 [Pyricularia grisea]TLD04392.1 hypothetical protein PgNI_12105 [Pyricularia grisea]